MTFYFGDILPFAPLLLEALWISLYVTFISFVVGGFFGIFLYLGKVGSIKALRVLCVVYIEIFRNTPGLVQLYMIYFGLPQVGINFDPVAAALVALSLNNAAYMAEIFRGGFESVPKGLREAGSALGMRPRQIFRYVELLPAVRAVFPALTNQLILLFLATSVASIIALPELTHEIMSINSTTSRTFEILAIGGLIYFGVSALLALSSRFTESKLFNWGVKAHV